MHPIRDEIGDGALPAPDRHRHHRSAERAERGALRAPRRLHRHRRCPAGRGCGEGRFTAPQPAWHGHSRERRARGASTSATAGSPRCTPRTGTSACAADWSRTCRVTDQDRAVFDVGWRACGTGASDRISPRRGARGRRSVTRRRRQRRGMRGRAALANGRASTRTPAPRRRCGRRRPRSARSRSACSARCFPERLVELPGARVRGALRSRQRRPRGRRRLVRRVRAPDGRVAYRRATWSATASPLPPRWDSCAQRSPRSPSMRRARRAADAAGRVPARSGDDGLRDRLLRACSIRRRACSSMRPPGTRRCCWSRRRARRTCSTTRSRRRSDGGDGSDRPRRASCSSLARCSCSTPTGSSSAEASASAAALERLRRGRRVARRRPGRAGLRQSRRRRSASSRRVRTMSPFSRCAFAGAGLELPPRLPGARRRSFASFARRCGRWLDERAVADATREARLLLAVGEACANAIEHAYRGRRDRRRSRSTIAEARIALFWSRVERLRHVPTPPRRATIAAAEPTSCARSPSTSAATRRRRERQYDSAFPWTNPRRA